MREKPPMWVPFPTPFRGRPQKTKNSPPAVPQANREDLRNQTHEVQPAKPAAPSEDEDAGPRLVIASHEFSRAQANYVALRHPENPRAPIFYKDATPRAEHYVRCGVRVEGVNHGVSVPVKIELCFPDGRMVQSKFETRPGREAESLKVLGDGAKHLTLPNPGAVVYFDYRIEVGSLRADDRKFCIKVSPDASHVAGVLPAITPGLLVLSKKRIAEPPPVSGDPLRKRARTAMAGGVPPLNYQPGMELPSTVSLLAAAALSAGAHEHTVARPHPGGQTHRNAAAAQRLAVLSNLPAEEQPTELLANTMRILDRVSDLETHVKFLTHHIQQLLQHGGAVVPAATPAATPAPSPQFGLSPARDSASPPPQDDFLQ